MCFTRNRRAAFAVSTTAINPRTVDYPRCPQTAPSSAGAADAPEHAPPGPREGAPVVDLDVAVRGLGDPAPARRRGLERQNEGNRAIIVGSREGRRNRSRACLDLVFRGHVYHRRATNFLSSSVARPSGVLRQGTKRCGVCAAAKDVFSVGRRYDRPTRHAVGACARGCLELPCILVKQTRCCNPADFVQRNRAIRSCWAKVGRNGDRRVGDISKVKALDGLRVVRIWDEPNQCIGIALVVGHAREVAFRGAAPTDESDDGIPRADARVKRHRNRRRACRGAEGF